MSITTLRLRSGCGLRLRSGCGLHLASIPHVRDSAQVAQHSADAVTPNTEHETRNAELFIGKQIKNQPDVCKIIGCKILVAFKI